MGFGLVLSSGISFSLDLNLSMAYVCTKVCILLSNWEILMDSRNSFTISTKIIAKNTKLTGEYTPVAAAPHVMTWGEDAHTDQQSRKQYPEHGILNLCLGLPDAQDNPYAVQHRCHQQYNSQCYGHSVLLGRKNCTNRIEMNMLSIYLTERPRFR